MDGWIKLHRKTRQSRVYKDPLTYLIWTECLLSASSTRHWVSVRTGRGETQVELLPGQFIFGRHAWEQRLKIANQKIYARIKKLIKWGNLRLKPNTHFSVVTICNWETYQGSDLGEEQPTEQPTIRQPSLNNQPTNTYKKEEKGKKGEKEEKKKERALADTPHPLIELIDGWNALKPKVKGTRPMPPLAQAVTKGWDRAQRDPEQREAFADIPAVLKAVGEAKFCHGKGWFTLPWLFGKNNKGEFNVLKLLEGGHRDDDRTKRIVGPGQEYDPNADRPDDPVGTF